MSKPGVRRLAIESLEDRSLLSIGSPTVAASIADSDICDIIYQEHFEDGTSGWGADNTGGEFAGLWHYSLGRRKDQLPNHSPDHSWYYGAFETSTGGGRFNLPGHRQGTLISPVLPRIPDCGKTTLSFNYLLDTRDNFDRDFVEVYVVEVDSGARTRIFSRAEGTLPETGNQWLTAISNSNLTPFAGETIRLEFVFNTGDPPQVDPEGWYVDDIMIVNCCEPISGYKWNDLDGDGIWDPNGRDGVANTADDELGLANWEIRAYADTNADGILQQAEYDAGPAPGGSGITDDDGRYGLKLSSGDYVIVEVLQEGWHQSYPHSPVLAAGLDTGSERLGCFGYQDTVVQGQRKNGFTFGNFQPTVAGTKFNDLDGDGAWDSGEPGLAGWTILAYRDSNEDGRLQQDEYDARPAGEDVTDCRGEYGLALDPGQYVIVEVLQNGWHQSFPTTPVLDLPLNTGAESLGCSGYVITVQEGAHATGLDFGNFQPTVAGRKFHDLNNDRAWEPDEPALAGWTIRAYVDTNQDGRLQQDEYNAGAAGEDVTDCRGEYGMVLAPGQYVIVEVLQDGWHQSYPTTPVLALPLNTDAEKLGCFGYVTTVQEGAHATGLDFGNFQPTVAGIKFNDLNGNRAWEPGEPALAGWTIRAYRDSNQDGKLQQAEYNVGAAGELVTDCRGEYGMVLAPGQYVIVEVLQDGWHQSYPTTPVLALPLNTGAEQLGCFGYVTTVQEGTHATGFDFGNFQPTVAGWKFHDLNGNRAWEPGEPALAGWTIRAYRDNDGDGTLQPDERAGVPAGEAVTDCRGEYGMVLDPGQYVIVEVLQEGWRQSYPAMPVLAEPLNTGDESLGRFGYPYTVVAGARETRLDFGNFQPDITGYKWDDLNGDGDWGETEAGRNGVVVYVDWNDNRIFDPGEPWEVTQDHDGLQGYFALTRGGKDTVMIRETYGEPMQTYPGAPDFGHRVDSPVFGRYGVAEPPNFGNGEPPPPPWLNLSGYVWDDWNRNGDWDSGEEGLNGRTVYLDLDGDGTPDPDEPARVTGNDGQRNGAYQFFVLPDEYSVRVVLQDGWQCTYPPADEHVVTPPIFGYYSATEPPNFGIFRPDIAGFKWNDRNADAWWDDDEVGLDGWTIYLYRDDDGNGVAEENELVDQAVTENGGEYWFANLDPGDYIVREQLQHGWKQSYPDSDDFQHRVRVLENRPILGLPGVAERPNFGNFQPDISGYKWDDVNRDGVWDAGEPGLARWEIRAYADTDGDGRLGQAEYNAGPLATEETDDQGWYGFELPTGTYVVVEVLQFDAGWLQSAPGTPVLAPDLITPGEDLGCFGYAVTIIGGEQHTGNDFGNYDSINKSGRKFNDRNRDGVWDPDGEDNVAGTADDEPGLAGWEIRAYADSDGDGRLGQAEYNAGPLATEETDDQGRYGFVRAAGDYVVVEVLQFDAGWLQSAPGTPVLASGLITPGEDLGWFGYAVTIAADELHPENDFGNYDGINKSGRKFNDRNADGVWDPDGEDNIAGTADDEPGLSGWEIRVYRDKDEDGTLGQAEYNFGPAATALTDCQGRYGFALPPSRYVVVEVFQDGWLPSAPLTPVLTAGLVTPGEKLGPFGYAVTVVGDEPHTQNDFGNFVPGISGYAWLDRVPDGEWDLDGEDDVIGTIDDEPGFNDQRIYLDLNGNGEWDVDEDQPWMNTRTHPVYEERDGFYWFAGIEPGLYPVRVAPLPDFEQTYPAGGAGHNVQIPPPMHGGWVETVPPNFGIRPEPRTLVEGVKYNDINGDGPYGADGELDTPDDDAGLAGWEIRAYPDDSPHDRKLNQSEYDRKVYVFYKTESGELLGKYSLDFATFPAQFAPPGDYIIVEVLAGGWQQTYPPDDPENSVLEPGLDTGTVRLGRSGYALHLEPGDIFQHRDFANQRVISKRQFLASSSASSAALGGGAVVFSSLFAETYGPEVTAALASALSDAPVSVASSTSVFPATAISDTIAAFIKPTAFDITARDAPVPAVHADSTLVISATRRSRSVPAPLQNAVSVDSLVSSVRAINPVSIGSALDPIAVDQLLGGELGDLDGNQ
ncbi:MAG: hypothetical protein GXY83_39110 [Rhodopirellula sp.]|nr:hypothetical protein [Rhodopirellula sp.]